MTIENGKVVFDNNKSIKLNDHIKAVETVAYPYIVHKYNPKTDDDLGMLELKNQNFYNIPCIGKYYFRNDKFRFIILTLDPDCTINTTELVNSINNMVTTLTARCQLLPIDSDITVGFQSKDLTIYIPLKPPTKITEYSILIQQSISLSA